jgi:phosphate:Na+ symporter
MFPAIVGGIGMFLLGMSLLTDGLQTAAGDALRTLLRRYTRTRLSALATGAFVTALVQSSSAVTVATIGFVGAGLLTFTGAFGVICGANVGTTATAWIVAGLGLKVTMSVVALPLIGVGAFCKLLLRGRGASVGLSLAGFGLIFVGLDTLQAGMATLGTRIDLARFAGDGLLARFALAGVGLVMTVVMQSSSAAVATSLAAVHSGTLTIEHAAAMVIGQNVGTTVTALLGSVGGTVAARRIAAAHVLFNVGTGVVALALFPAFVALVVRVFGRSEPALTVSGFHSVFNVLGVAIFLPLAGPIGLLLARLIPARGHTLTARLTRAQTTVAAVAVEAAQKTARVIAVATFRALATRLRGEGKLHTHSLDELRGALDATRAYLAGLRADPASPRTYGAHVAALHALDHLHALVEALEPAQFAGVLAASDTLRPVALVLATRLDDAAHWLESDAEAGAPPLDEAAADMVERRKVLRVEILAATARGEESPERGGAELETVAWMERIAQRAARVQYHLTVATAREASEAPPSRTSQMPEAV